MKRPWGRIGFAAVLTAVLAFGCATAPKTPSAGAGETHSRHAEGSSGADSSGVEVVGLRPALAGRLLDFRFRVVDPEKATGMLDRRVPAYLVNERTGVRMVIPFTKIGSMRQSTPSPEKGRVYFMLFNAAGQQFAPEDRLAVVVGPHRFENLTVQQGRGEHHETRTH